MWAQLGTFLVVTVLIVAGALRGRRWRKKHEHDPQVAVPVVSSVSAFTGEIIASGQANTELGDGAPPECGAP